jgi:UDP-2-acetamido-2-deoxy-ribo-hexuluronate aminotransferase
MTKLEFIDLKAQRAYLGDRIENSVSAVMDHGKFIMGPEVAQFEKQLAAFGSAEYALCCGNGTDALFLPFLAWSIGNGDAVFCPSFTFAATAEMVALAGATPIFIDVDAKSFNIDTQNLRSAIEATLLDSSLTPKAVIAVDLFGRPADYAELRTICDEFGLKLISDAAQGFGATVDGNHSSKFADCVTTSFFPAKPLGCYGDGGAILTNDGDLATVINSLRVHGQGEDKYDNVRIGTNSRLDTIQAAILIEKLAIFGEEIEKRMAIASRYSEGLADIVAIPETPEGHVLTWAQYTICTDNRDALQKGLGDNGIPSVVYYAKPLHLQSAYCGFPVAGNGLPVTESLPGRVLSIPMHPYLEKDAQDFIISTIRNLV